MDTQNASGLTGDENNGDAKAHHNSVQVDLKHTSKYFKYIVKLVSALWKMITTKLINILRRQLRFY